jgi:hypothetical protein
MTDEKDEQGEGCFGTGLLIFIIAASAIMQGIDAFVNFLRGIFK